MFKRVLEDDYGPQGGKSCENQVLGECSNNMFALVGSLDQEEVEALRYNEVSFSSSEVALRS